MKGIDMYRIEEQRINGEMLVTERRAISSVTMTSVRVLVDLVTPGSL